MTAYMERASKHLAELEARLLSTAPPEGAPIFGWTWVCGSKVAEVAVATQFSNGELTVTVPDERWRQQLVELASTYLGRYEKVLPGRVRRIHFQLRSQ